MIEGFQKFNEKFASFCIVEDQSTFPKKNPDIWGAKLSGDGIEYVGPNLMGRLLMELRDAGGKLSYTLPPTATSFQDLASL